MVLGRFFRCCQTTILIVPGVFLSSRGAGMSWRVAAPPLWPKMIMDDWSTGGCHEHDTKVVDKRDEELWNSEISWTWVVKSWIRRLVSGHPFNFGRPFLILIPIRWMISSSNFFLVLTSWRNKCPMVLAAVYSKGRGSIPTPFPATGMTTLIGQHFEPFWKESAAVTSCLWRTLRITKLFSEWFSECCETTAVFPVVKWTGVVSARLRLLRDVMVSKLRLESCLSDDRVNDAWWPLRMAQLWSTVFLIQGLLYQSVLSEKQLTQTYITFSSCLRLGAFIFSNPLWIKVGNHSFSEAGSEIRPCGGKDHWKDRHCWSFFHGVASELDGVRHWQPWGRLSCWGLHMCLGSRLLPLCVVSSFVRSSAWTHTHTLRILFGGLTGDVNISTFNRNRY